MAAVLKDKVVLDMQAENTRLHALLEQQLLVQITGNNGTPIYYEQSCKNGRSTGHDGRYWSLTFPPTKDNNNNTLPFDVLYDFEIRLGGTVVQQMSSNTLEGICNVFGTDVDASVDAQEIPQLCGIGFEPIHQDHADGPIACVEGRIGPMLYNDYKDLDIITLPQLQTLHRAGTIPTITITEIEFHKHKISGIMQLLQQLRILPPPSAAAAAILDSDNDNADDNATATATHTNHDTEAVAATTTGVRAVTTQSQRTLSEETI